MTAKLSVAALISGRGSNLQALLDATRNEDFPARVVLVISNVADAPGLKRAHAAGVETLVIDHKAYPSREAFDDAMDQALGERGIELVCLAGFMRLLSPEFVLRWSGRLINIHPSLLPLFRGLHPHRQALAAGVKLHGCTVHFVTPDVDDGPIIAQAVVAVEDDDDEARLAARVLEAEHVIYPLALRLLGEGRITIEGRRVRVAKQPARTADRFVNPEA